MDIFHEVPQRGTESSAEAYSSLHAGMAACGAAWVALRRLAQGFIYVEWNHALND